jgi:hypothetical protein
MAIGNSTSILSGYRKKLSRLKDRAAKVAVKKNE